MDKFEPVQQVGAQDLTAWLDALQKANDGFHPLENFWEWTQTHWFAGYVIESKRCKALADHLETLIPLMPDDSVAKIGGPKAFTLEFIKGLRHSAETGANVSLTWHERRR